ncbi:MAG: hypothetical protein ACOCXR_01145 [Phototrophicaceae bacterium]
MTLEVSFDIQAGGSDEAPDAWLDPYETQMMLDTTRAQIEAHVRQALTGMTCATHNESPRVLITGVYDAETEQLDISYDVDTCCKPFLAQCIAALNQR